MDYLSKLLTNMEKQNKIKGVKIGENFNLTHLLFADDILLFIEDNDKYFSNLRYVLHAFEVATRLNINLNKSTISPINIDLNRAETVTIRWGIKVQHMPINYLGVPLGGKPTSKHFWDNRNLSCFRHSHKT